MYLVETLILFLLTCIFINRHAVYNLKVKLTNRTNEFESLNNVYDFLNSFRLNCHYNITSDLPQKIHQTERHN